MLKPSMNELMKRVGNRYLLVNLAAQRARDIAQEAEENQDPLPDKAVKLALDEIAAGTIVYKPGPKVEEPQATMPREMSGTLDLDFDDEEDEESAEHDDEQDADAEDDEQKDENA